MQKAKKREKIFQSVKEPKREHLIPLLQEIQESEGYISPEAVKALGQFLRLPASKIYGVATFYNQFRFKPIGKYHIQVCRGTACHVKGSSSVMQTLAHEFHLKPGETTRDGLFSLEVVACLGACGLAPVVSINGEFYANMTGPKLVTLLRKLQRKETQNN
ncbi:NADH-quinone oxidoreductase subunit NuoE [Caldithrix abyssi]|uniref:NADH dehydrogenase (Ubiquinone) 24 kDa subunit n=1 Tax=Caldithrix abyssi DSM 13497 TaxID=880073 RepID=H1XPS4_CALAY|nr:NADH-quinone oxidoreductase subunit NuoE [Caldithrix abyssi]APF20422.1 NADH-quinone oxidoreductase subunit E [Caldithrix abyssi DSM 13497]EHO41050.1 NADH dehydrogenase (ubiquinone) 24 kDa subunit [Caldithrix abyssi DSM 13497]